MKYLTATANGSPSPVLGVLGNTAVASTLVNNDIVNSVWLSDKAAVAPGDSDAIEIPALGSAPLDTNATTYFVTMGPKVQCLIMPGTGGWTASPSKIQLSLNALGLAKDTTVQAVNTTLGNPSQDGSTQAITTTLGTPPQKSDVVLVGTNVNALNTGIPNNIAATGVPLLTSSALVKNQGAISQNPGVISQSATFAITQIGYEINLQIWATGNFLSFYHIGLSWFDSGTGLQTGQEDYWLVPGTGSGANAHVILGRGATKGNQLVVTSEVPASSSVAVTHQYTILQNSRIYNSDRWRTIQFVAAGQTGTATDPTTGAIASTNANVNGAGTVLGRFLPFYHGLAKVTMSTTSGGTDGDLSLVQVADWSQAGANLPNLTVYHAKTNSSGLLYDEVTFPKSQLQAAITNNNAAAKTFGLSIIASEQQVD